MQDSNKPISYLTLAIIGFAMHLSILVYGFVIVYLGSMNPGWEFGWRVLPDKRAMFWVLAIMALSCAGLALAIPKILKTNAPEAASQAGSESLFFNFSPPTMRVQQVTIIRMAIAEAIAIFGVVLAFLNQSVLLVAPFLALGLLVQFIVGPLGGKIFGGPTQS